MLIDEVKIKIKAGNGGAGAVSFRRNAQTSKGGPDGGNGGNGGDIYLEGISDIIALRQFQFKKVIKASDGVAGQKNNLYGKNAEDLIVKVPVGTQVTDEKNDKSFEIISEGERILVVKGGIGGKGNNSFKTATNQAPKFAEKGVAGEEKDLTLILKIAADIGLIGFPNAGKSSILEALTNAHPKIGDYPFTTLEPNLGVLDGLVIADIPGLIENASIGRGLGIKFLKHIERTKMLIHCLSLENPNPVKAYELINKEMETFSKDLPKKTKIVVLTKKDLFSGSEVETKAKQLTDLGIAVIPFSIYDNNDIQYLKKEIHAVLSDA